MIELNQLPGNDKDLIWVIMIDLNGTYYRFIYGSNEDVTLDNVYKAGVIEKNSLVHTPRTLNISNGGTIGSVAALNFSISQRKGISLDDIAPATGKPNLTSCSVYFGFFWNGATSDSDITWKERFVVENISADTETLTLFCVESAELELIKLPYYVTQKDYDDGISYAPYLNGVAELGTPIPLLYGEWDIYQPQNGIVKLAPCLMVDANKNKFIVASHQCGYRTSQSDDLYKYIDDANSYIKISSESAVVVNSGKGHSIEFGFAEMTGELTIRYDLPGTISRQYSTPKEVVSGITNHIPYCQLKTNQLMIFQSKSKVTSERVGTLGKGHNDIKFVVVWASASNPNNLVQIQPRGLIETGTILQELLGEIFVQSTSSTGGTLEIAFGDATGWSGTNRIKSTQDLPWKMEDLTETLFYVINKTTTPSDSFITLNAVYLKLTNIQVYNING